LGLVAVSLIVVSIEQRELPSLVRLHLSSLLLVAL
jgi:hypothetical protein